MRFLVIYYPLWSSKFLQIFRLAGVGKTSGERYWVPWIHRCNGEWIRDHHYAGALRESDALSVTRGVRPAKCLGQMGPDELVSRYPEVTMLLMEPVG